MEENQKILNILKWVIVGFLLFAIILLIFATGMWVGEKRAEFSFQWAENYHRNFGGPSKGFLNNFPESDFVNGHGIFGTIIKIENNTLIIKDQDTIEKTVLVMPQTMVKNNFDTVQLSDLKTGEKVVIIGSNNEQGQIEASLIRVFTPESPTMRRLFEKNM